MIIVYTKMQSPNTPNEKVHASFFDEPNYPPLIIGSKYPYDLTYTAVDRIGIGGYSVVDKYVNENGHVVAIKTSIPHSSDIESAYFKELHILGILRNCPYVVKLLQCTIGVEEEYAHITYMLEYYSSDLTKFISTIPTVTRIRQVENMFRQLVLGLSALCEYGIIHGDIKPENILVTYDYSSYEGILKNEPRCVLADFGTSIQTVCTYNAMIEGSPYTYYYLPPECGSGKSTYGFKSDIWALGVTMLQYFIKNYLYKSACNMTDRDYRMILLKPLLINGHINVHHYLEEYLSKFHINMISQNLIEMLAKMLVIDYADRISIQELSNRICKIQEDVATQKKFTPNMTCILDGFSYKHNINTFKPDERHMITRLQSGPYAASDRAKLYPLDKELYVNVVKMFIIELGKSFSLSIESIVIGIHMFDKCLCSGSSDSYINDIEEFKAKAVSCLMLGAKICESYYNIELADYAFQTGINMDLLRKAESRNLCYIGRDCRELLEYATTLKTGDHLDYEKILKDFSKC